MKGRRKTPYAGAGVRVVPIFGELYPYLPDAFEQGEAGEVHCCPQYSNANQMYRKFILHFIPQAGLKPWPKVFQNLRSSRQTELSNQYPGHVTCRWVGDEQSAVCGGVRKDAAPCECTEPQSVGTTGLEPVTSSL